MARTLTAQEKGQREIFVAGVLEGLTYTEAAKKAGYSKKTAYSKGSKLANEPAVAEAIAAGRRHAVERAGVKREDVIAGLHAEALGADHPGARVRAWELLGKDIGMWPNKVEHSGPKGEPISIVFNLSPP